MNKTGIEYLDYTWNPIAMRCTPISEGCQKCWHITRAKMLAKNPTISAFAQKAHAGESGPRLINSRLDDPCKVKKPSRVGVQFMGDLFHENVTDKQIDSIFTQMAYDQCWPLSGLFNKQIHTFLLLTKRPERILSGHPEHFERWPNIWLGISAESQKRYDERWTIASQIPAAVKFVSIEPALEYVNIDLLGESGPFPDWVIWGPETGPGKRPFRAEWAAMTYQICKLKGIPFFDKRKDYLARERPG